jgi:hypothetical protein
MLYDGIPRTNTQTVSTVPYTGAQWSNMPFAMVSDGSPAPLPGFIEGRCIHYVAYNNRHLAGMIIGRDGSKADLVVFTNLANVNGVKNFGVQFHQDIEHDEELKIPGTWHHIEA